ncbi:family 43 glycosylhydrolase [Spirosoma foliorum]|uniref:family 43 glycosylhydrolase n=1 Tax=Spirosoma foliorum TaxID=2710596 RepID=UPI001F0A28A6|nr:family 43 glycosylhydrolase [Spirosoma foliorum]
MFISTKFTLSALSLLCLSAEIGVCQTAPTKPKPLVTDIYTADPSAHVFNGKIYIYPSHDIEANVPQDDEGGHFNMRDYHVFSMDNINGKVIDHGVALDIKEVPWAGRQMWAPDAAYKNGTYYLYFPVKDKEDVFRIGVATSKSPTGPFKAEPAPIPGSYSIDPAVFTDTDGKTYMYFGGIWGGQLQRWHTGKYDKSLSTDLKKDNQPALSAKVVRMSFQEESFGFDSASFRLACAKEEIIANVKPNPRSGAVESEELYQGGEHIVDEELYKEHSVIEHANAWIDGRFGGPIQSPISAI